MRVFVIAAAAAWAAMTYVALVGCSTDSIESAGQLAVTDSLRAALLYEPETSVAEPLLNDGTVIEFSVEDFVDTLVPLIDDPELISQVADAGLDGTALEGWLEEHILVDDGQFSPYLMALAWNTIAPPAEFQVQILEQERSLENDDGPNQSTRRETKARYLKELAHQWLQVNSDSSPDWLLIVD